jgi:hypothetical protein
MTREENILDEMNKAERLLKHALEDGETSIIDETLAYINGMKDMLRLLGYRAVEDDSKSEFVNEYWVYTYKAIEDRR